MSLRPEMSSKMNFTAISINLSSPDKILERSHGEVTKPETINYRSFKPEKDGLFCEKIFGPVRDWECHCGKYKRIRYKGIICDRCGVEVTMKSVRRERMGHITLAVPVVHIWYWKSLPSKIGYILGMSMAELEKIIYYESYVVIQPGKTGLKPKELISEDEYFRIISEFPEITDESVPEEERFIVKIGGEAILDLLKRTDIDKLSEELRHQILVDSSIQRKNEALKRLKVIEAFKRSRFHKENKPEWMVMTVIPVIPPELRPLVPLEGGRFATSDLNDLYRRVIIRNNRLKKLLEIKAPEVILRNEKRMLQEAVDSLFDNGRKAAAVRSDGNRALKSLSDMLRGKQGRFRQNLLGKRIDYSGRSVIVVGPELKMHECGLPKEMALELFKPFVIRKLVSRGLVKTVKSAKKMVEKRGNEVWEILEEIIEDHPILLNRAPTLHRLGIQAFQPVLIEGKAIQIHPLVCAAFNADFDGDQMAVHIPLSFYAQVETKILMLSTHNILSPANGRPIAIPSQDMVLGCYYLTKAKPGDLGEGKMFSSPEEVLLAYENKAVGLHAKIKVRMNGKLIETTTGRVIFNQIVPEGIEYINELLTKKRLEEIVANIYSKLGNLVTAVFLDKIKELGFYYAMKGGITIGMDDVITPEEKPQILQKRMAEVEKIMKQYENQIITDGERYNKIIDIWTHTTSDVAETMWEKLKKADNGFNPIYMMADSGARGSREQIRQLAAMRGLMAKPQKKMTGEMGEIIENPIMSNFKEGLTVLEYFISTHGARKGLADTALKTADAGYLTRRLVDVAQDVIISEEDCGTILGLRIGDLKEGEEVIEPLRDRILGRVAAEDVFDEKGNVLVEAGKLIDEETADLIYNAGIETVNIRSVLTCESKRGVCRLCYGRNLATGKLVNIGEAVGVMAAQSIGEPGTQLTLRTFHIGGTAARIAAQSQATAKQDGIVVYENLRYVERNEGYYIAIARNGKIKLLDDDNRTLSVYIVPYGAEILVKANDRVTKGQVMFRWDPYVTGILAFHSGRVEFIDIIENVTYREEADEATGLRQRVVIESRNRSLSPQIRIVDEQGNELSSYILPIRASIQVKEGDMVKAGDYLVKIPREIAKTRDITGGLPRVAELFEARRPKEPAIVSEIDGRVKFGEIRRGVRKITVTSRDGQEEKVYQIPYGKHILVHDGDFVEAGEKLCEGSVAPHDILNIMGANKVQEYLVNEIQEVYRLQGVRINDKHIEVIVRQMLQKIKVEDPGDTYYLPGDQVDRLTFQEENNKIRGMVVITDPGDADVKVNDLMTRTEFDRMNQKLTKAKKTPAKARPARPATFQPLLLGITKASLTTESFISAASFQETTRVLTDASIEGKIDYLRGLKENVVMGNLIPAGTGLSKYKKIKVYSPMEEEEPPKEPAKPEDATKAEELTM
ncbi:MAG: DNA-directed RNA polymerase subunit beta' [candidate division KSB1 bacterium]|nr:DNA-directed RNA polymerase subunit beta' [candidate division KSB1 bacterium]MDZ7334675.1 DNA-directed RNA polymerase subunit beta' [candidate division KSB1 bacterium]MDZ7358510.1 DNA-directed RNA polymerase subunit beta' [candidate division KSB1 bacterium]MDZ7375498.1 DNA-directed RNA polymerase subunit beta' [candidate division KSB1 bacterium]MDZ7402430.1 DNA-directed RNA polymerase subunit beta' [candidate division KSB1 bacterium]